jgi:hypothetical protein
VLAQELADWAVIKFFLRAELHPRTSLAHFEVTAPLNELPSIQNPPVSHCKDKVTHSCSPSGKDRPVCQRRKVASQVQRIYSLTGSTKARIKALGSTNALNSARIFNASSHIGSLLGKGKAKPQRQG